MGTKIALVTGAGSGIGQAVAIKLACEGYKVFLAGRRQAALEATIAELQPEFQSSCYPIATDVSIAESVAELFAEIHQRTGHLDLLFNNAGINIPAASIEAIEVEDWKRVVDTNLTGMFLCIQHAVRLMKSQSPRGGRIVNNGSISAHSPRPGSAAYTATKHAITGLTKATNLDCRDFNIPCGQIDIGNADTPLVAKLGDTEPKMAVQEVADAVLYMARLPLTTNVPFMTVMANQMSYMGRG